MASFRFSGSQGRYPLLPEIGDGTLCRQASPRPGSVGGVSLWPGLYAPGFLPAALGMASAITDADKAEFATIKRMPVYDSKRRPYRHVQSSPTARSTLARRPCTLRSPPSPTPSTIGGGR